LNIVNKAQDTFLDPLCFPMSSRLSDTFVSIELIEYRYMLLMLCTIILLIGWLCKVKSSGLVSPIPIPLYFEGIKAG